MNSATRVVVLLFFHCISMICVCYVYTIIINNRNPTFSLSAGEQIFRPQSEYSSVDGFHGFWSYGRLYNTTCNRVYFIPCCKKKFPLHFVFRDKELNLIDPTERLRVIINDPMNNCTNKCVAHHYPKFAKFCQNLTESLE